MERWETITEATVASFSDLFALLIENVDSKKVIIKAISNYVNINRFVESWFTNVFLMFRILFLNQLNHVFLFKSRGVPHFIEKGWGMGKIYKGGGGGAQTPLPTV